MSKQHIAKSALWVVISEIVFNLSGYIIHSVVGRILGPADYGRYGLVVTLTTMVIILIGNGIPTAMAKYISEIFDSNPAMVLAIKRRAIFLQSAIIGSITLLFYLLSPLIARILGDPTLTHLFRISTLIIPAFAAASFYFSYYTGLHLFNLQSILKVSRSAVKVIAIILLAYFFHLKGSIVGYILAPASVFLIAWLIDRFSVTKKIRAQITAQKLETASFPWQKLTNYAWQIIIFFLAYELLISIDLYLVKGILHSDYQTGIYNAALTVGRIPYYIFYALTVILLPTISKSTSENNHAETNKIINQSLKVMIILLVPAVVLMSVFAEPIIRIFYTSKYIDAAAPMAILVGGVGFLTIFYVMSFVSNGAGKTKRPMLISIFGLVINTILNYILIKKYALIGSAIATSISSLIVMLVALYYIRKDFKITLKIKNYLKIIFAGIIMYSLSLFFSQGRFIFILWAIILLFIYFAILYFMGEIEKEEIIFFRKMLFRKNNK
ncbi:MAG: Polysaccharide biosynthesis protein [Candidatus Moranbacteria bacterium GW2011_GWE2_35_2-]|nr:MAG: Polysaccharide biosynthesis protein [Candidatus Moranbacteria bacterium GW2011_GWE2_35_2-]KKQ22808.1 MAG: Polysaccharide biosynthesis protein [Candidatus Moranbacteria bacterium GW2011_GWF2_37_11]KKQ28819.1 MAG: Polysaccharide biosynthesis protein [Candidatus Moranbacteria bacterium GW2011_GWD1_37_17]KKQ30961.1 MAG: Polysaccharide biosynthesis protein [Candidatus Moranbacteria bacterium GW2011_GWE1_37_24]KKQ47687.1 MAG: Polysaccharide biosynthesis protein [Candidatus Moranbacteria bacte